MSPPAKRFALTAPSSAPPLRLAQELQEPPAQSDLQRTPQVTRRVSREGRISLAGFVYHVGTWLGGETVAVTMRDGLLEICHRGVLIACHARRHPLEAEPRVWQQRPRAQRLRPQTAGRPVTRKVGSGGESASPVPATVWATATAASRSRCAWSETRCRSRRRESSSARTPRATTARKSTAPSPIPLAAPRKSTATSDRSLREV